LANTLSALAPTLFSAAKEVANEPVAVIQAIDSRFDNKGVAKGDTVTVPVAPVRVLSDFTPNNTTSSGDDAVATSVGVQITAAKKVSWNLSGEQQRSLENGTISMDWVSQLVKQGMRALRNQAEIDAWTAVVSGASRAYGTAGTAPFASDLSALTNMRKILQDNGAPLSDLYFVGNTAAGLNLRNLGIIQQAYAAGSDAERRSGVFQRQFGFVMEESAGVGLHTAGTGSGYLVSSGPLAVGTTVITCGTGTGTILVGDVVSFAGDTNKYVVTGALSAGSFTIGKPGLQVAASNGAAITVTANYTANIAMERSAVVGIMRPPLIPANPTIQQMPISDPFGMSYLMLDIAQYGQRSWELHLAWGFKSVNGEFSAIAIG
jgi:hypothetical protein